MAIFLRRAIQEIANYVRVLPLWGRTTCVNFSPGKIHASYLAMTALTEYVLSTRLQSPAPVPPRNASECENASSTTIPFLTDRSRMFAV